MYNLEKVLYLADSKGRLHVANNEFDRYKHHHTTLGGIVKDCIKAGFLVLDKKDSASHYYKITLKGQIRLLKMQIDWRKSNGKNVISHESRIRQLEQEYFTQTGIQPSYVPSKAKRKRDGKPRDSIKANLNEYEAFVSEKGSEELF